MISTRFTIEELQEIQKFKEAEPHEVPFAEADTWYQSTFQFGWGYNRISVAYSGTCLCVVYRYKEHLFRINDYRTQYSAGWYDELKDYLNSLEPGKQVVI